MKYTAIEKLVKQEVTPPEPVVEDPTSVSTSIEELPETDPVEVMPLKFNIQPVEVARPENQTNLLDEIEERSVIPTDPPSIEKEVMVEVQEKIKPKTTKKKPTKAKSGQSLNDKLAGAEPVSLADKLKKQPITNLASSIGINQKFLFMNDLFQGERDAFHESIAHLDKFDSYLDADNYIKNNLVAKYGWDMENSSAVRFMEMVERRYLS